MLDDFVIAYDALFYSSMLGLMGVMFLGCVKCVVSNYVLVGYNCRTSIESSAH